jgi:hypothetical protein
MANEKQKDTRVVFKDGFAKAKDWVVLASELASLADDEVDFTRAFTFKSGAWRHVDLEGVSVRAVQGAPPPARGTYFLGRAGEVIHVSPDGTSTELLTDAGTDPGKLGYVNRMRAIAGTLYVCGTNGQVYRRNRSGWEHFDKEIRAANKDTGPNLYGIDGAMEESIFVVGDSGSVLRHDGEKWSREEPFTSEILTSVRCISREEVYVCGRNGKLFRRQAVRWEDLSLRRGGVHFWSVEVFEQQAFLASSNGLYAIQQGKLLPVDTGLNPKPDAYRLHAVDGVLWSFGNHNLCFFDGKKWTYVKHPDNPE